MTHALYAALALDTLLLALLLWRLERAAQAVTRWCATPDLSSGATAATTPPVHPSRAPRPDPALRPRTGRGGDTRHPDGPTVCIRYQDAWSPHALGHPALYIEAPSDDAAWDVLIRSDRSAA